VATDENKTIQVLHNCELNMRSTSRNFWRRSNKQHKYKRHAEVDFCQPDSVEKATGLKKHFDPSHPPVTKQNILLLAQLIFKRSRRI